MSSGISNVLMYSLRIQYHILYADDTCVLISGNHLNDLIDRLNTELISLNSWFKANKLSLNTKKIIFMIFHRSRIKPNVINKVVIDNHQLTQVNLVQNILV